MISARKIAKLQAMEGVDAALVREFMNKFQLKAPEGSWLESWIKDKPKRDVTDLIEEISDLEELIALFEKLVPSSSSKTMGVVYTPADIRKVLIKKALPTPGKFLDPACGAGFFLIDGARHIHDLSGEKYKEIFENYVYGIDIDSTAIDRAKAAISLFCLLHGEKEPRFNLINMNTLDRERLEKEMAGVDLQAVITNPPFVRNRNIADPVRPSLENWQVSQGLSDLYFPFYEAGVGLLKGHGKLAFISPNSFLQAANARYLRKYLKDLNKEIEIIDFRDQQIFAGATNYTCICFIDLDKDSDILNYARANNLDNISYVPYPFEKLGNNRWRIQAEADSIIQKLESKEYSLGQWKIRNGLATLKNDVYFFDADKEDEDYFYRTYNGKQYKIEKGICIDVVKPNILHNEEDLSRYIQKAIFPYSLEGSEIRILEEDKFISEFPKAYSFLSDQKETLAMRDKGKKKYPAWYAYGRVQGIRNQGQKLLIPYIASRPVAVMSYDPDLLFYCGYALYVDDEEEMRIMKTFLESDAFAWYISHTSKPYVNGYMALAKNYLIHFSIPKLKEEDKEVLLTETNNDKKQSYIWKLYGINEIPELRI